MKISVAICTWNRHELLACTLREMEGVLIPPGVEWELLVVNNNCTDSTDEVIGSYAKTLPVRRVFEPRPGLSNARNAALREAAGEYILWTDDDVLVDAHWVEAYARAFLRFPDAVLFGGSIAPWFEGTPPRWLSAAWPNIATAYATRDAGNSADPITPTNLPFGANYAVRLPCHRHYLYDPLLGRKGEGMLGGEEIAVIHAMLRDGLHGRWVPEAQVRHFIPRSRQNMRYLRRYYHGQGLYNAHLHRNPDTPSLFGLPRWLVRRAVQAELAYRTKRYLASPGVWIEDLKEASRCWGQLKGYASQRSAVGEGDEVAK